MEKEKRRGGNIPLETVEEILVKSLVRFKAVSKEWRGTLESKYFIEKHIGFQKSRRGHSRILALSSEESCDGIVFDSMLFSTNGILHEISPYLPIKSFRESEGIQITLPCDGLFCMYTIRSTITRISIFNPATTCCRSVPDPNPIIRYDRRRVYTLLGIGRENSERRRYKLVYISEFADIKVNESTKCKVFFLDSNTWRYVDPPPCRLFYGHSLVHLDGVIHCFTGSEHDKVLAIDLHTHKFQSFSTTPDIFKSIYSCNLGMCVLNHRLCIFQYLDVTIMDPLFKIWCLDINKRSLEMMYTINLSNFPPHKWSIIPIATINNSIVTSNYFHNFWAHYNSKNHFICRTFSLLRKRTYFVIPNYFETLVSPYQ